MADNGVLFKLMAKSVGMKYGIMPTFMAKPYGNVSKRTGKDLPVYLTLAFARSSRDARVTFTSRYGRPTAKTPLRFQTKRSRQEVVRTRNTRTPSIFQRRQSTFWRVS